MHPPSKGRKKDPQGRIILCIMMNFVRFFEWDNRDDEEDIVVRAPKRYIRDTQNPLEKYDDGQFRRRFRFKKQTVVNILLPLLFPERNNTSNRGLPVPPLLQMLVALRYYASSSYQRTGKKTVKRLPTTGLALPTASKTVCSDLFEISQPTVHRISKFISERLARKITEFIKLPETTTEVNSTWRAFYRKARFPGIIGLVDGTHIPIISPGGDQAEVFRNRKGYFSLNVQVVGGPNEEIMDIVCRWPGSAHDSRIFENSAIRLRLEEQHTRLGHLLGDAGYAQKPYIFTPLLNPTTNAERRYNKAHKTTRSLIERTIGRWKRRFPCLYFELQTDLDHTLRIIPACAILYNIGLRAGDLWTSEDDDVGQLPDNEVPTPPQTETTNSIRREFINRHFT